MICARLFYSIFQCHVWKCLHLAPTTPIYSISLPLMEVHSILHSLSHTHKPTLFLYLPFSWSRAPTQACLAWQTVESSRVEPIHRHIHRMHCVQKKSIKINVFIVSLSPNLMQWKYWLNKLKCTYNKLYEIGIEMPEHRELASVGEIDRSKWCTLPVATCKLTFTVFYQATE